MPEDQANLNAEDGANEYFESQAILLDTVGQHLATVQASLTPKLRCGGFRLPSSADVSLILASVASLKMSDGRQFQLKNLRRCTGVHSTNADQPHIEFDFVPEP